MKDMIKEEGRKEGTSKALDEINWQAKLSLVLFLVYPS
jgi:hypothetical protein